MTCYWNCSGKNVRTEQPTAKSRKGETRVPNAIFGTDQLRETTLTENPWFSKATGVEHKASNLVS